MSEPMDRRRFLAQSLTGLAGAAVVVVAGPEFIATAGATSPGGGSGAKGPNLVFGWNFERDTVGAGPRAWIIS